VAPRGVALSGGGAVDDVGAQVKEGDVLDFFARARVVPLGVSIVLGARGGPSGEAFAEFQTEQDMQSALSLNKDSMGHRCAAPRPPHVQQGRVSPVKAVAMSWFRPKE
jgi:hypothetical protein